MKKETILGIVRHALTFAGGILVSKGLADEATATELVGGLITVIGAVWSILAKRKAGGPSAAALLLAFSLPAALALAGCGSVKPTGGVDLTYGADGTITAGTGLDVGTNATVTGSGSYNVSTGAWSVGISIVFRDAPAAETVAALVKAGAYPREPRNWVLPEYTRTMDSTRAIELALRDGATLKRL